jgi:hypothetical protein
MSAWTTHNWFTRQPREIEIEGRLLLQLKCRKCLRDFVKDEKWRAVHVTALRFQLLDDEVNSRWLVQPCPGSPLLSDDEDRRKIRIPPRDPGLPSSHQVARY